MPFTRRKPQTYACDAASLEVLTGLFREILSQMIPAAMDRR